MAYTVSGSRLRDARTVLLFFIGLTIAALIAQTCWTILQDRELTINGEQRNGMTTVRALEGHSSRLLQEAEHMLDGAASALQPLGHELAANPKAVHALLKSERGDLDAIADLWLASPSGIVFARSARFPFAAVDLSATSHIAFVIATPSHRKPVLGYAARSADDGEWFVPLVRNLYDRQGRRVGILGASLKARSFYEFYARITDPRFATVTFRTSDGIQLVRSPFDESALSKDVSGTPIEKKIRSGGPEGSFEEVSIFDTRHRLYAYRKSQAFSVITTYSLDMDRVLSPWKIRSRDRILLTGGTVLLIGVLTFFLLFHIKRLQRSEASLSASEGRYRMLYEGATDGVFLLSRKQVFTDCNSAAVRLLGVPDKSHIIGRQASDFSPPDQPGAKASDVERQRLIDAALGGAPQQVEWAVLRAGTIHISEVTLSPASTGEEQLVLCIFRDISSRKQAEELQKGQNRILHFIAAGAELQTILNEILLFIEQRVPDSRCMVLLLNEERTRFNWGAGPSIPDSMMQYMSGMPVRPGGGASSEAVLSQYPIMVEDIASSLLMHDMRDIHLQNGFLACGCWPIMGKRGQILGAFSMLYGEQRLPSPHDVQLVGISTDLAGIAVESRWSEDRIRHLAHYDELTGLPNRFLFIQHLNRALSRAERNQLPVGVLFLDLDRFKNINDTFGHDTGDNVLRSISSNFRACLRESDTIARAGGDEFIILVDGSSDGRSLGDVATRLLLEAAKPFDIDGQECQLSASIGIAAYPLDGSSAQMLLKNADIAMYRAKSNGKNNYQFYSSEMNTHTVERLVLETRLRRAIERHEFVVHYQPKLDVLSGNLVGAEALVRWQHPELGLLLPNSFIGLAEEAGLIGQIGMLVLEDACKGISAFRDAGITFGRVAINLSGAQFNDFRLLDDVRKMTDAFGTDPAMLEFEITESMVMNNRDQAITLMDGIRNLGCTLSIDDFGTGYSSLSYLKRFPVNSVKIDKSFINDIPSDPNDLAIVQAIIVMAHTLGLKVTAEGVETAIQLKTLQEFGCDEYQGFYFSRAVSESEFIAIARRRDVDLYKLATP